MVQRQLICTHGWIPEVHYLVWGCSFSWYNMTKLSDKATQLVGQRMRVCVCVCAYVCAQVLQFALALMKAFIDFTASWQGRKCMLHDNRCTQREEAACMHSYMNNKVYGSWGSLWPKHWSVHFFPLWQWSMQKVWWMFLAFDRLISAYTIRICIYIYTYLASRFCQSAY